MHIGAENKAFQAVIMEPSDEIENVVVSNKTKKKNCEAKDLANVLSIILINEKFEI